MNAHRKWFPGFEEGAKPTVLRNLVGKRRAVTLVELLIVIGVLTILATLALTTVKGLLKDQKVTQASRQVKQYLEVAKIRAITNGRPVAVFFDRLQLTGDPVTPTNPVAGNFMSTRLSLGEMFPPYSGDVISATGTLWDVDMTQNAVTGSTYANVAARGADGFADQIRFDPADVFSGFGISGTIPGMVRPGDLIQFEGSSQQFVIESIDWVSDPNLGGITVPAVTFFNPPAPMAYNATMVSLGLRPPLPLMPNYSTSEPQFPTEAGVSIPGIEAPTPTGGSPPTVNFRVYRRPTKSMVGALTLPRGTCVDLYASGVGLTGSVADGVTSPFYLWGDHPSQSMPAGTPSTPNVPPGFVDLNGDGTPEPIRQNSFSRVAVVFDGTGKAIGMFREDKIVPATGGEAGIALRNGFQAFPMDSVLYLLVGRTEQVFLDGSRFSRPNESSDQGTPLSNVLDPANSWISVNPLTGNVSANPIGAIPEADRAIFEGNNDFAGLVSATRTFASAGVDNNGE